MSLILKGIDLPSKDKSPLVITVWADGVVCSVDSNGGIEETTSAIQISKGHGKIGDIDYIEDNIVEYGDLPTEYLNTDFVISALEGAPYYLETEE